MRGWAEAGNFYQDPWSEVCVLVIPQDTPDDFYAESIHNLFRPREQEMIDAIMRCYFKGACSRDKNLNVLWKMGEKGRIGKCSSSTCNMKFCKKPLPIFIGVTGQVSGLWRIQCTRGMMDLISEFFGDEEYGTALTLSRRRWIFRSCFHYLQEAIKGRWPPSLREWPRDIKMLGWQTLE